MQQRGSWQIEFRDGPLKGQSRSVDVEPGEEIEVSAEEGGPCTYLRVASIGAREASDPVRVVFDLEPALESRGRKRARSLRRTGTRIGIMNARINARDTERKNDRGPR